MRVNSDKAKRPLEDVKHLFLRPKTMTAKLDLASVLSAVTRLPLRYWKKDMFFTGAKNKDLSALTEKCFPAKASGRGTHPVFSLKLLPDGVGCQVCPCTSKQPFKQQRFRFIAKGCTLLHSNHVMDRNSYLVEAVRFNIPPSMASDLLFRGQVPQECIRARNRNNS